MAPHIFIALVMVTILSTATEVSANDQLRENCTRDIGDDVSALVNRSPVVLADLKVADDGRVHKSIAEALGVENSGRTTDASGLETPSPIEQELTLRVTDDPCFRAFERIIAQGMEDVSGVNRAVMQLELPFSDYRVLTVEYSPGKYRRNHLFQIGFGFELRDADGKVVFARSFADQFRRTCFWEGTESDCRDLAGDLVDPATEWRNILEHSVSALLSRVGSQLSAWRLLLAESRGEFFDRRYSRDREIDALQVRNREQLALPYLFVQTPTPRVNIRPLLGGFEERGFAADSIQRSTLQNHFNVLFRSYLDKSLQAAISRRGDAVNARIVLLSDAQSEAFENAIIVSCAEQSPAFNREDCLEPVKLIERLCDVRSAEFQSHRNPRGDACVLSSLTFGAALTRTADESLRSVRDAEQRIQAASYLRSAQTPRSSERVACMSVEAKKPVGHVVGVSDRYFRVDGAAENDDYIYLMDAAINATQLQADCLADALLAQYEEMRQQKLSRAEESTENFRQ